MQTLFDTTIPPTFGERFWGFVRRHRALSTALFVAAVASGLVVMAYQRFTFMQHPNPDFDARVPHPAYTAGHPRVLFDAAHFNFHTAAGNYRPFADLIRNDGYEVVANRRAFSAAALAGARILVIANALGLQGVVAMLANLVGWHSALQWDFRAFSPAEADAVRDWVAAGGSLLLISDHAPTGRAAQILAGRFGVEMSNWFTEDEQHSDPDAYGWLVFSRENGLLLSHAVTEGRGTEERVGKVVSFNGQSLKGPAGSVPFLQLAATAVEYPGRASTLAEGRSAAGRAQGVALTFGKGRVVVLGEAAMLSAQVFSLPGRALRLGMDYPGCDNRRLALNIVHWLSGLTN